MKTVSLAICLLTFMGLSLPSLAASPDTLDGSLEELQQRWASIHYASAENEQERALAALSQDAEALVAAWPDRAEARIWQGIILSTYAGAKGGLSALNLVKDAREALEAALRLDEKALDGSAHTSLGSLYYQVPGWPLSFGDDAIAEQHLLAALAINPDGIDPNYFYADFLAREGREDQARLYLQKALQAGDRPGRELADQGRRTEIRHLLESMD